MALTDFTTTTNGYLDSTTIGSGGTLLTAGSALLSYQNWPVVTAASFIPPLASSTYVCQVSVNLASMHELEFHLCGLSSATFHPPQRLSASLIPLVLFTFDISCLIFAVFLLIAWLYLMLHNQFWSAGLQLIACFCASMPPPEHIALFIILHGICDLPMNRDGAKRVAIYPSTSKSRPFHPVPSVFNQVLSFQRSFVHDVLY